jgi:hypothetical protein
VGTKFIRKKCLKEKKPEKRLNRNPIEAFTKNLSKAHLKPSFQQSFSESFSISNQKPLILVFCFKLLMNDGEDNREED